MAICIEKSGETHFNWDLISCIEQNKNFKAKSILQRHENLNELVDSSGRTLLHISAKYGNATITRFLIESGCKVNAQDSKGETPLMLVSTKAVSTAKILLEADACMQVTDARGTSALKKLVKSCTSEWRSLDANRHILQVFYEKLKEVCQEEEAIARKLCDAECPLPIVVLLNDSRMSRLYMRERGCVLDERTHGLTALHVAVQMADLGNVRLLLEYGADVNGMDRIQETPLCKYRTESEDTSDKIEVLKILLEHGALLDATVTKEFGYRELIAKRLLTQGKRKTILTLLENMDLSSKYGSNGQTPLQFLVQNVNPGAEDGIRLLISKNVDVNVRDKKGRTAFTIAVAKCFTDRVKFLLAYGAKASLLDIVEKTPLIQVLMKKSCFGLYEENSSQRHYAKVIKLLVRYDIDFQSVPEKSDYRKNKNLIFIKLALAYLVIAEDSGRTISATSQALIQSKNILRNHYNWCKKKLQEIKTITIHGSVTTYKLLTESEEKLVNYVCNQKLISDFQWMMKTKICRDSYYYYILQKRVGKAIQIAKLREEAARITCKITGLPVNEHRHIVNKIVSYMSNQDYKRLFQVSKFI